MHFYPLATVILMALGTVASPVEKRQLAPPPQGCQDTDLYIRCANINSAICYIPWTTGVWYVPSHDLLSFLFLWQFPRNSD